MPLVAYRLGDLDKALRFRIAQINLQRHVVDTLVPFNGKRQDQGFDQSSLVDNAIGRHHTLARSAGRFNRYAHSQPQ